MAGVVTYLRGTCCLSVLVVTVLGRDGVGLRLHILSLFAFCLVLFSLIGVTPWKLAILCDTSARFLPSLLILASLVHCCHVETCTPCCFRVLSSLKMTLLPQDHALSSSQCLLGFSVVS